VPGAAFQFDRIARLFDLSGRIEEARKCRISKPAAEGSPDSALVSAFLLSFQMNDAESMSADTPRSLRERAEAQTSFCLPFRTCAEVIARRPEPL